MPGGLLLLVSCGDTLFTPSPVPLPACLPACLFFFPPVSLPACQQNRMFLLCLLCLSVGLSVLSAVPALFLPPLFWSHVNVGLFLISMLVSFWSQFWLLDCLIVPLSYHKPPFCNPVEKDEDYRSSCAFPLMGR
jgi:hypothetical protein